MQNGLVVGLPQDLCSFPTGSSGHLAVRAVAVGHLRLRHLVCKRTSLRLKLGTEAQDKVLYRMDNRNDSFERVEFGADVSTGGGKTRSLRRHLYGTYVV